jgi:hypothetical protein
VGLPVIFEDYCKWLPHIKRGGGAVQLLGLAGAGAVRVSAGVDGLTGMGNGVNQARSNDNQQLIIRVVLVMAGRQISRGA